MGVFVDDIAQVLPPDGAVKGAEHLDVVQSHDGRRLVQKGHHLGAVLAHDVGVVAPGVVNPLPVEVHLVGEQLPVQGAEGAESVGGEEDAVGGVEGDHGLRPVDHGGVDKGDGVLAEAAAVPLFYLVDLVGVQGEAELVEERHRLGGGDDFHLGPAEEDFLNGGGVIRLYVVDDQVVQGTARQDGLDVGDELAAHRPVGGVEEDGLLVQEHVGVVADAMVQGMDIFKEGQAVLVRAYPVEIVGDLTVVIHRSASLF